MYQLGGHFCFSFWRGGHVVCRILVARQEIEPQPLAVRAWSPKNWTAREFLAEAVLWPNGSISNAWFIKISHIYISIYFWICKVCFLCFGWALPTSPSCMEVFEVCCDSVFPSSWLRSGASSAAVCFKQPPVHLLQLTHVRPVWHTVPYGILNESAPAQAICSLNFLKRENAHYWTLTFALFICFLIPATKTCCPDA